MLLKRAQEEVVSVEHAARRRKMFLDRNTPLPRRLYQKTNCVVSLQACAQCYVFRRIRVPNTTCRSVLVLT
jgi:hypothetical protein